MKKSLFIDTEDLTNGIIKLIVNKYPNGYCYEDIISIKNNVGNYIKVIEVENNNTKYFVKIGIQLENRLDDFIIKNQHQEDKDFDIYFDDYYL
jgi:hypothetical protein